MVEMTCNQAKSLFDVYLDGDLSGSLATELAAHRVRCGACRRELALMEVAGHVIRVDSDGPALSEDFSDRLLACLDQSSPSISRARRRLMLWSGGALAAAAALALMFSLLAGPKNRILGSFEEINDGAIAESDDADSAAPAGAQADEIAQRLQVGISDSSQRVLELKDLTDKTIMQLLGEFGLEPELSADHEGGLAVAPDAEPAD